MPAYARWAIPILLALLLVTLAWRGIRWTLHPARQQPYVQATPGAAPPIPWQRDFMDSLDEAAREGGAGNFTAAEIVVDRAESILTAARIQSAAGEPEFFRAALAGLDLVTQQRPDDARLLDHVTLARVSLAELRSSMNVAPDVSNPVSLTSPRELAADFTLDPAKLRSNSLDATLMPGTAEILLPPASRSFADHVRVENLTITGTAQTLDGIRWRNVTFVGTRLRYEGGELDLQNVRCVRCRFGFPSDDRGARLANALALGQSSITLEAPPPAPAP